MLLNYRSLVSKRLLKHFLKTSKVFHECIDSLFLTEFYLFLLTFISILEVFFFNLIVTVQVF